MFLQIMSEMWCQTIEFPDWCWNPHMIQHVKHFWLSCVCVTNTRNVELQLIQFVCSSLECGLWFFFSHGVWVNLSFVSTSGKLLNKQSKYLKLSTELKLCLMWVFVFLKRAHNTVRVIQGLDSLLLHIIWKWLQLFVNCWPETIKWLEKWWKIGFTLTARQFPVHSKKVFKEEDLHRIFPHSLTDEQ